MKKNWHIVVHAIYIAVLFTYTIGYSQQLVSGQPIPSGTPVGNFAPPSLTGAVMGVVQIQNQEKPSLFLYGDQLNPGMFLYHFKHFTANGQPVFSKPIDVKTPFEDKGSNRGVVIQTSNKDVYGFWRFSRTMKYAKYNAQTNSFENLKTITVQDLPSGYATFNAIPLANDKFLFVFSVRQKGMFADPSGSRDNLFYTPEGFWPYELPYVGIYGCVIDDFEQVRSVEVKALTGFDVALFSISGFTKLSYQKADYLVCGTRLGNLRTYRIDSSAGKLKETGYLVDAEHVLHRHPTVNAYPAYFTADGRDGIITSGEGGIYFFENLKQQDKSGNFVFNSPVPLQQENPLLYGGSLVVPNLVDWDGDELIDIISGTSTGHIFFFKNTGSNAAPSYLPPVALTAGGEVIHVQPGYREDIQGPGESRWGYTCPTVFDWNGDGLPDILTGDSRGKFMVYMNKGTKTKPRLDVERPLYLDGMDMYGGWRVKPGIADLDGQTAYIILDRDNELHLYWRMDNFNLRDGGKLTLEDGTYIKANRRSGGQVGRIKIHVVDWDRDGVKDLLIGTGRAQSIPNPSDGLPYNWGTKNQGASVLFLRNVGTHQNPIYEYPKMLKFKGKPLLLGAHSCVPATGRIGYGDKPNLVVGIEKGTYLFYKYDDLSW